MEKIKMIGEPLPNMPWQDKPKDIDAPVWRYSENPIIKRNPVKNVSRIFNSAVLPYEGAYIGVFRGEQTNGIPTEARSKLSNCDLQLLSWNGHPAATCSIFTK